MVNDANVTLTDVISSNGLIHVIDKVLMPTDSPRDIQEQHNVQVSTIRWLQVLREFTQTLGRPIHNLRPNRSSLH